MKKNIPAPLNYQGCKKLAKKILEQNQRSGFTLKSKKETLDWWAQEALIETKKICLN